MLIIRIVKTVSGKVKDKIVKWYLCACSCLVTTHLGVRNWSSYIFNDYIRKNSLADQSVSSHIFTEEGITAWNITRFFQANF